MPNPDAYERGTLPVFSHSHYTWRTAGLDVVGPAGSRHLQSKREVVMSKGMDQKKSKKKEPEKSLKEKRAAKQEKKKK